jgi:hypothetical protein
MALRYGLLWMVTLTTASAQILVDESSRDGKTMLAGLLGLLVLAGAAPVAAQSRSRAEAGDFLAFLQSVAARRTAQVCERGITDYRSRFDELYTRWSARYGDRITRGQARFSEALANKDLARTERTKLEEVERALEDLAQTPRSTDPITLTESMRGVCDENLQELEKQLEP